MLIQKKSIEQFYRDIQEYFPEIKKLPTWINYAWYKGGSEHSMIMSEIAKEMILWASENRWTETEKMMTFIESAFSEYDVITSSFIYTDFLVEITEIKDKKLRERIKAFMQNETACQYKQLLTIYKEL